MRIRREAEKVVDELEANCFGVIRGVAMRVQILSGLLDQLFGELNLPSDPEQ